jgi:hypothetical protein
LLSGILLRKRIKKGLKMSVVRDKVLFMKEVGIMMVCVYCSNLYTEGITVCPECNEYDGMMPVKNDKEEGK